MSIRLLRGDCRLTLAGLEPGSVQVCITSPPYWGLRSYGTPDLVWGGDAEHEHEWLRIDEFHNHGDSTAGAKQKSNNGAVTDRGQVHYAFCPCGAWLGSLGLEPTPELFVEHIVECFRAVKRVLSDTGVIWVNMGDSYSGSGNGSNDHRANGASISKNDLKYQGQRPGNTVGYKAKDLIGTPWMVAFALRADGWYLRSDVIWSKPNPMPESVGDRPTRSHEYLFLLSKSRTYYYDAAAIAEPSVYAGEQLGIVRGSKRRAFAMGVNPSGNEKPGADANIAATRNRRSVWTINTQPFVGAHFAVMPDALVEPCIKASTQPGDTVCDPFAGSGTVGLVADRLGRSAVLCELKPEYCDLGTDRIIGDSPMFVELESA